jgi:hypothetical protein
VQPSAQAVSVGGVLHFDAPPLAKAAASCTISTACTSGEPALDAQISERKRSLMLIQYIRDGRGFVCSATLIDTPQRPVANVLTANHCISTQTVASTLTSLWFYEQGTCGGANTPGTQVAGGMQLVFTNFNVDSTLLRMNQAPPQGASYAPLDPALVPDNTTLVSISHPTGDSSRWATGTMEAQVRPSTIAVPYNMYYLRFSRGLIQGGSSGSGAFTRGASGLALTGVLSLGPIDDSCAATSPKYALYGRLEAFYPQIAQYIGAASPAPDDEPNRPGDVVADIAPGPLDARSQPVSVTRRIDYAGDVDLYRFTLSAPAVVTLYTEGALDLVSTLLDSNGVAITANDDAQAIDNNTGITRSLQAGSYYVHIAHWVPSGTGAYTLVVRADRVDSNYTALWWAGEAESGWGLNVNHQGNVIFATLFTYDDDGAPMWLVMSQGDKQADGSYLGTLRRTTGPPFNSSPWGSYAQADVGTMRLTFFGPNAANLAYSVNGRQVNKSISRLNFKTPPQCDWSFFDRTYADNVQDLWINPAEAGWGINLTQQENTVFATLFTYGADRRDLWLLMSGGTMDSGGQVTGDLFRTRGPRFDSSNWSATPIGYTKVGTMTLDFEDGNHGTLRYTVDGAQVIKPITRFVFGNLKTQCVQ